MVNDVERSPSSLAIVFDIGGVLTSAEGGVPELSALTGVDQARFAGPYWQHRPDFDRGAPADGYWPKVAADLGLDWGPQEVRRFDDLDAARWARLAPGRSELLSALQTGGVSTTLLSNAPVSMTRVVRESDWSAGFEQRIFSCELGVIKPEPRIYQAVEQALGRTGTELVFFDDREANVEAARQRGWQAHRWTTLRACRETLTGLGLPVGPAQA